jgi:DNA-binding NarL/FixJ family response regulator
MSTIIIVPGGEVKITPRQLEIIRLASHGVDCKGMAQQFGTSKKTVEVHRHKILQKLNCVTMAGAVGMALRAKLFE